MNEGKDEKSRSKSIKERERMKKEIVRRKRGGEGEKRGRCVKEGGYLTFLSPPCLS